MSLGYPKMTLIAALLAAANAEAAQYQEIREIEIRHAAQADYEHFLARLVSAAAETGSPQPFTTFEIVTGKKRPTYRIVSPFQIWAERDGWSAAREVLTEAHGEEEARLLWSASRRAIVAESSQIWQRLPDSESNPRDTTANFYEIYVREVRAGTERSIRDLHRKFKEAYDRAPSRPSVSRSVLVFGRNQSLVFHRAEAFDRWAERDDAEARGVLGAHFGAEAAQAMVDTVRAAAVWTDHFVSAYRPELSYRPGPSATGETREP